MRAASVPAWYWSERTSSRVAYCVWILTVDGLKVPPFERHPEGDAALQGEGLDARTWSDWLAQVVGTETSAAPSGPVARPEAPSTLWRGSPACRSALDALWHDYLPIGRAWKTAVKPGLFTRLSRGEQRAWFDALRQRSQGVEPLSIYPVQYPEVVAMSVPPRSIVVGVPTISRQSARLAAGALVGVADALAPR